MTNMKAEKGDLIRIVKAFEGERYRDGEILEVVAANQKWSGVDAKLTIAGNSTNVHVLHTEYVIHRKAGEEDSESYCDNCGLEEFSGDCAHCSEEYEPAKSQDAVNPQHYKQGRVEVIDIIEDAVEGADPFEAVCQANVLKYALRYRHKNGVEDLRKSIWYTERLIAYLDAKSTQ